MNRKDDTTTRYNTVNDSADVAPIENSTAPPRLDPDKYRAYLANMEMTEAQQDEFLETLWNIMRTFVEIGWGLDSVQTLFSGIVEKAMRDERDTLEQKDHFNQIAGHSGDDNKERSC